MIKSKLGKELKYDLHIRMVKFCPFCGKEEIVEERRFYPYRNCWLCRFCNLHFTSEIDFGSHFKENEERT